MSSDELTDSIALEALSIFALLPLEDIPNLDDSCAICLMTFRSICSPDGDDSIGKMNSGVVRVNGCGHLFCTEDILEWIKGRHGTCPTCRHEFLPDLRPVDSDTESSDGGEYIPTEYDGDTDIDTDEDRFMDSDGIDMETMDVDGHALYPGDIDETPPTRYRSSLQEVETLSNYGSDVWWDDTVDGEQEWGLTDGESMSTSEGELTQGSGFSEENIEVRLNSEGEYTIYEDADEPKC
ncbi:hypothetical protein BC834DRAFT_968392 [Gloeopeniophorella convolvens]|nr:hypothetical protein BC834DRAFT_968392 [Gloeopeniophorella convolvens]